MDYSDTDRQFFAKSFAKRLCNSLIEKGYTSNTASSGVKVASLAKAANCSKQMARRYALGEAVPEYPTLLSIAQWLDVSPGWLLFGEKTIFSRGDRQTELVGIDFALLTYILSHSAELFSLSEDKDEVVNFIIDVIYDAAHIDAHDTMRKKIIDMALSSAYRFHVTKKKNKDVSCDSAVDPEQTAIATG